MQYNNFNERQKRITIIKFFGELYCFQIIENGYLNFVVIYLLIILIIFRHFIFDAIQIVRIRP